MSVPAFRLTLLAATVLAACGSSSSSGRQSSPGRQSSTTAAATPAPRGDVFKGSITAATGRLAAKHGHVTVVLARPPLSAGTSTPLTLTIRGADCGGRSSCLRLLGHVTGQMTMVRSLPDVGHRFDLTARGTVSPLGHVRVQGTAAGTGFIRSGHTGLNLTLRGAGGTVTIAALSGPVPGHTDP